VCVSYIIRGGGEGVSFRFFLILGILQCLLDYLCVVQKSKFNVWPGLNFIVRSQLYLVTLSRDFISTLFCDLVTWPRLLILLWLGRIPLSQLYCVTRSRDLDSTLFCDLVTWPCINFIVWLGYVTLSNFILWPGHMTLFNLYCVTWSRDLDSTLLCDLVM
jgi:hypothetical protein